MVVMTAGKKAKTEAAAAKGAVLAADEEMNQMMMMCNDNCREEKEKKMMRDDGVSSGRMMRKGPWTEQEDVQLVWFVRLFGERRWDFLAKVSGLKRTGKSCRLRWVNYLHPGLKRGRITADEERLILQLHAQWGSRWSRIARSLPGRTDNEIKNYWRTHMRKMAQEAKKKKTAAPAPSSSSSFSSSLTSCSASSNNGTTATTAATTTSSALTTRALQESSGDDEAVDQVAATTPASQHQHQQLEDYTTMDQMWNDIAAVEAETSFAESWGTAGGEHDADAAMPASPVWEFCTDYSLWRIDDEEYYKRMLDAS